MLLIFASRLLFASKAQFVSALPTNSQKITNIPKEDEDERLKVYLEKQGFGIDSVIQASDSGFLIHTNTGEDFVLKENDPYSQIDSLQRIFHQLTMEGKKVVRLDLRFEKPVVVFK